MKAKQSFNTINISNSQIETTGFVFKVNQCQCKHVDS